MIINLVKTKRSNAIISTVQPLHGKDGWFHALDRSSNNWRYNSADRPSLGIAMSWMRSRGYKYMVMDDGSFVSIDEWRSIYENIHAEIR